MDPIEYHSKMEGRPGGHDVMVPILRRRILVSIRCLDEGVDIPDVSHALILASSQNPRQFIQRRGRVLRRAPGKSCRRIVHDSIVTPVSAGDDEPEQIELCSDQNWCVGYNLQIRR